MAYLILGLVVFLGVHSLRIVADGWRTAQLERLGEARWKGLFSLASAVGLALINTILNDEVREQYLAQNSELLRDQAQVFYTSIITGIDPAITLEFKFPD